MTTHDTTVLRPNDARLLDLGRQHGELYARSESNETTDDQRGELIAPMQEIEAEVAEIGADSLAGVLPKVRIAHWLVKGHLAADAPATALLASILTDLEGLAGQEGAA